MKLTLETFFKHYIFHPFDAKSDEDKAIAFAASIFLTLGIVPLVSAIYRCCQTEVPSELDERVSKLRDAIFSDKNVNPENIEVKLPAKINKVINKLFKGLPFTFEDLPTYPALVTDLPNITTMTAPIMKGKSTDGKRLIFVKVECEITEENIQKVAGSNEYLLEHYRQNPQLQTIFVLFQYHLDGPLSEGNGEFLWHQLDYGNTAKPQFFSWNFTCPITAKITSSQKENFKNLQKLFQTGESTDLIGLTWRISE